MERGSPILSSIDVVTHLSRVPDASNFLNTMNFVTFFLLSYPYPRNYKHFNHRL